MASPMTPIPDSFQTIQGYPSKLKVYRVTASPYWQMRTWMDGRMICRSSKSESLTAARELAKEFYNELLLKKAQNKSLVQTSEFKTVATSMIAEDKSRVERGERAATLVSDAEYILEKDLLPFFAKDPLKSIGYQRIIDYTARLQDRKVGSNTIKNHFIVLRKVLKHAHQLNLIDKLPIFPKVSVQDNPREWFTKEQYKTLRETLKVCVGQQPKDKKCHYAITDELRLLTTFLVNTFLRPADIKDLQHRDITVVENKNTRYLRIKADSKTKPSVVISMPDAVGIYKSLRELNKGHMEPDDFVFLPALTNRGYAFQTLRLQFNHVLELADLKKTAGPDRTLYSLRHTAIMFRLINGGSIDLLTLARNCRTSVGMIDRFYASHLTPEMQVASIQSMKE